MYLPEQPIVRSKKNLVVEISIAREVALALDLRAPKNNSKKILRGVLDRVEVCNVMPSQRSADKETLSFYVPRTLGRRLRKMAKLLGVTLTDVIVMIISKETANIELTPEDYEQIARDTRAAQRKNSTRPKASA